MECYNLFFISTYGKILVLLWVIIMEKKIIKKIDIAGRLIVPKFFREILDLECGEEVEIFMVDEKTIGIRKKEDNAG